MLAGFDFLEDVGEQVRVLFMQELVDAEVLVDVQAQLHIGVRLLEWHLYYKLVFVF